MNNSNWTLRWNRSAREAYGHSVEFEPHWGDRLVGYGAIFAFGFFFGLIVAGVV